MHGLFIPAYFMVHFDNVPVKYTCSLHILYIKNKYSKLYIL